MRVAMGNRGTIRRFYGDHIGPVAASSSGEEVIVAGVVEDPYSETYGDLKVQHVDACDHEGDWELHPVSDVLANPTYILHPAERFFLERFASRTRIQLAGLQTRRDWEKLNGISGHQVAPDLFVVPLRSPTLPPARHTNMIVLRDAGLVVDPAAVSTTERDRALTVLREYQSQEGALQAIWLTHHHHDHIGSAAYLADRLGLPIWGHPATAERLDLPINRVFRHGEKIPDCGASEGTWTALHTPGHAPGHLCLWQSTSGRVVAGDMVAGEGTILIDPEDGDMGQYLDSLRYLAGLNPSQLFPAHGPVIMQGRAYLEYYVDHRLAREKKVLDAVGVEPTEFTQILSSSYDDIGPSAMPFAMRSLRSHLKKLLSDGQVRPCENDSYQRVS